MAQENKIVFASGKSGDYDIWTLDLKKKKLAQLTSGAYWNDCPKWSPDGKHIVFVSNRSGTPEIWIMDEFGENQTRITKTEKWHNTPDWSPDGKELVFCANYDGNIDLYTMNINGSGVKQLTDYPGIDFTPQFSPDSKKIIFTSQRSGNDDVWMYDLKSKESTQLTTYKERDFSPTYSPDGRFIAFVCGESGGYGQENLNIFLMDNDGQNRKRLTDNLGTDRYVAWSSDGRSLIYTASRAESTTERMMVLELANSKSKELVFDREPLDKEAGFNLPKPWGIFSLLPKKIYEGIYPDIYLGSERYPDWK